jgi:hypothetical protein
MEFPHVHLPHLRHTLRYHTHDTQAFFNKIPILSVITVFRIRIDLAVLESIFMFFYFFLPTAYNFQIQVDISFIICFTLFGRKDEIK